MFFAWLAIARRDHARGYGYNFPFRRTAQVEEVGTMVGIIPNPCSSDCPRRAIGCHAYCRDYIEFDEANKRERERRLRIVQENDALMTLELNRNRNLMTRGTTLRHGKSLGGKQQDGKIR